MIRMIKVIHQARNNFFTFPNTRLGRLVGPHLIIVNCLHVL